MASTPTPQPERGFGRPLRLGETLLGIVIAIGTIGGFLVTAGIKVGSVELQVEDCRKAQDRMDAELDDLQKTKADRAELDKLSDKMDALDKKIDGLKDIILARRR